MNIEEFNKIWKGRKFRCKDTDTVFVVPDCVAPRDFFLFGNCFVDVGDGHYARYGGHVEEIVDDTQGEQSEPIPVGD